MSERSIRRSTQRRSDRERRRAAVLGRRAAGAAIGATLLLGGTAQAASYEVTTLSDHAPDGCTTADCTLREAVAAVDADNTAGTVTFASGLSGTITLSQGEIAATGQELTIEGPGADVITVSGNDETRLFAFNANGSGPLQNAVVIEDLTLRDGNGVGAVASSRGGAIYAEVGTLTLIDTIVTDNDTAGEGGAIAMPVDREAQDPQGYTKYGSTIQLIDSTVSGNAADGDGGAIMGQNVTTTRSTLSGNETDGRGGAIFSTGKYLGFTLTDSVVTGNSAVSGGGVATVDNGGGGKYQKRIERSTVANNTASAEGGGMAILGSSAGTLTVERSTISGNDAGGEGGGVRIAAGSLFATNATIANNEATNGGGISADADLTLRNSTIAGNAAATSGGGIKARPVGTAPDLDSTILADNTANGAGEDIDGDPTTSLTARFSLVENPGDTTVTTGADTPATLTADPKLGALADNGGPTRTKLPASDSPVVDKGRNTQALSLDQRGDQRIDDQPAIPNAADGTDIGAVELDGTGPVVVSTGPSGASTTTGGDTADFEVTFNEEVTGVDASDFALTTTGLEGATIESVSGTDRTRTVRVKTGTRDGTIRLDVKADGTIEDPSGNGQTAPFTGGTPLQVDKAPLPEAIDPEDATITNAASVRFGVTFDQPVTGVDASDFALDVTGPTGASITNVTPDEEGPARGGGAPVRDSYVVTVATGSGEGTIDLDLLDDDTIVDGTGKPLSRGLEGDDPYTIDRTAPALAIDQAEDQADPAGGGSIRFKLSASETVAGLDASDIALGGTAGATKAEVNGDGKSFVVTVSGMTQDGTVTASVPAAAAKDPAGNDSAAATSKDNSVTWAKPFAAPPAVAPPAVTCKRVPTLVGNTLVYTKRVLRLSNCTSRLVIANPKPTYKDSKLIVSIQIPKPGVARAGGDTVTVYVRRKPSNKKKWVALARRLRKEQGVTRTGR